MMAMAVSPEAIHPHLFVALDVFDREAFSCRIGHAKRVSLWYFLNRDCAYFDVVTELPCTRFTIRKFSFYRSDSF